MMVASPPDSRAQAMRASLWRPGAKSPGKDKETHWLPGPTAPFSLYIRCYLANAGSHQRYVDSAEGGKSRIGRRLCGSAVGRRRPKLTYWFLWAARRLNHFQSE